MVLLCLHPLRQDLPAAPGSWRRRPTPRWLPALATPSAPPLLTLPFSPTTSSPRRLRVRPVSSSLPSLPPRRRSCCQPPTPVSSLLILIAQTQPQPPSSLHGTEINLKATGRLEATFSNGSHAEIELNRGVLCLCVLGVGGGGGSLRHFFPSLKSQTVENGSLDACAFLHSYPLHGHHRNR